MFFIVFLKELIEMMNTKNIIQCNRAIGMLLLVLNKEILMKSFIHFPFDIIGIVSGIRSMSLERRSVVVLWI